MKHFTSVRDVPNVDAWIQQALQFKAAPYGHASFGKHKTLGLVFFNPSLRTRMSTQKAAYQLGMDVMTLNVGSDSWQIELQDGTVMNAGTQEHIKEAAGVLSQYCDVIGVRTFPTLTDRAQDYADAVLQKFIAHTSVPVLSLESAILHPLQSFADAITIREHQPHSRPKVVLTWAPHPRALPQAVANSFLQWMQQLDVELVLTHPKGWELASEYTENVSITHIQEEALTGADFVYAKNWSSYHNYGAIATDKADWMIDSLKMQKTNNAYFMHCLPVRRNVVVSDAVLDSPRSLILAQANNRTFAAQTVLYNLLQHE